MPEPLHSPAQIKPEQVFEIIVRRRWFILIPLCISLSLGLFFTLTAKKTYKSSTMILVQQQSVPTAYVRSVVTSSINQRINTISQQILSRSNLEKIIDQFGLYAGSGSMYLEDKIASMRQRIHVKIERARHGAEAFSISFQGSDPSKVMRITNTLASFFMDENLKVREAQAIGTSEFLDSELEKTRRRLEAREQKLSAYRSKYLGGLPDELESNLRTLDRLQEQLVGKNDLLRDSKNSLSLLDAQISEAQRTATQDRYVSSENTSGTVSQFSSENEEKLYLAEKAYEELLSSYTEKHPDVVKLKKTIDNLKLAMEKETSPSQLTDGDEPVSPLKKRINGVLTQMQLSRKQGVSDITKIKADIQAIEKKMELYQARVEDTPKRELELQSLKRDYNNIRDIFNSLLDRKLEAELSVNMEKKQKGEQFRILDHARLSEKPISPNIKKFFLLSVATGLGIGAGIIFLLEFFDSAIRRDEQLEEDLGLTILANIPQLQVAGDKKRWRLETAGFVMAGLYMLLVFSFFTILNVKGLDRTITFIKMNFNV